MISVRSLNQTSEKNISDVIHANKHMYLCTYVNIMKHFYNVLILLRPVYQQQDKAADRGSGKKSIKKIYECCMYVRMCA